MSLRDLIQSDIANVFFRDTQDYAESLKIGTNSANAEMCLGSLQANTVDNTSGNTAALQAFSHVLYVPYPIGGKLRLNAGQIIYINDVAYKVNDITDEYDVATIMLSRKG